ncbi:MAG: hypothetical protein JKY65_13735 [Planctomycetes bacterium]|nr:hypothetical protein [Planctomycetota bacterium]
MGSIDELCTTVIAAQEARDSAKSTLDDATGALNEAKSALASAMVEAETAKTTFDGRKFATNTKVSWKTRSKHKDDLLSLLRTEAPEVVKESVHSATLNKFMNEKEKEWSEEGPEWWTTARDYVERLEDTVLSITKTKAKAKAKDSDGD